MPSSGACRANQAEWAWITCFGELAERAVAPTAVAELGGERVKLQVFSLRSMASGGAFHRTYRHATQQAFCKSRPTPSLRSLMPSCSSPTM